MSFARLGLVVLLLSGCFMGVAHAQSLPDSGDDSDDNYVRPPPRDYGAGYQIIMFHQYQEHAPGAGDNENGQQPITLEKTYPLIANPRPPDAKAFNTKMQQMAAKWWTGPQNNTTASDPDTNLTLDCEPVGLTPPRDVDVSTPSGYSMVPGVISAVCENYTFILGFPHGEGSYWGFNWVVNQRRELRASDIFDMKAGWLHALTVAANADRGVGFNGVQYPLDFSDTSHWVVTAVGLGLTYRDSAFTGFLEGGEGTFCLIP